jgi:CRP/FNR family cyclic AMP-dependent transcriptional regulator
MAIKHTISATALRTIPVFQGLEAERLEEVTRCATLRRVARGTTVVQSGETTDNVYFVLNGSLKVLVSDEDGREVILTIINQGEVFGEMGVLDAAPRSATVTAVAASDLIVIAQSDFRQIMANNFDVCLRLMCNMARRLRDADRKIESLALMDVYGRVARLLLDMAEPYGENSIIRKKVSKQDIARMIGASREMVSRVMKDLQGRGLLEDTVEGLVIIEQVAAAD